MSMKFYIAHIIDPFFSEGSFVYLYIRIIGGALNYLLELFHYTPLGASLFSKRYTSLRNIEFRKFYNP